MTNKIKLHCNLMALMVERGLTPEQLAVKSNVSLAYIQAWINDIVPLQDADHSLLVKLVNGLDLQFISELFKEIEKNDKSRKNTNRCAQERG